MHDTTTRESAQDLTLIAEAAYEPTEADLADYRAWSQERDERLFSERLAADEDAAHADLCRAESDARLAAAVFAAVKGTDFRQMLYDLANAFNDHDAADVRFVGGIIGTAGDLACHLEAKSGESFIDRKQAMLAAVDWSKSR